MYTWRRELSGGQSPPSSLTGTSPKELSPKTRRTGNEYRWRVLHRAPTSPSRCTTTRLEPPRRRHTLRSHLTSAGNWDAIERVAADLSSAHVARRSKPPSTHGYYERPREVTVKTSHRYSTCPVRPFSTSSERRDRIVSQFVEETL
ncbi:hypothetical protein C9J85_10280 [Haloferax sp. wsp5]|nr:hypothetical protein C9J85_10280 [Haloferax sp. wsp5]